MLKSFIIQSMLELIIIISLLYLFTDNQYSFAYNYAILLTAKFLYTFIIYEEKDTTTKLI